MRGRVREPAELYAYPRVLANYTAVKRAKIVRSLYARAVEFGTLMQKANERRVIHIMYNVATGDDGNFSATFHLQFSINIHSLTH